MKIYSNYSYYNKYTPSFTGRPEKIIELLKTTINYKTLKVTPDEAMKIYEKLGYSVRKKAGSHVTITHPNGLEFSLHLPHGGEKRFLHPDHVRTLQCAVFEDFQKLIHSLHFHKK